MLELRFPIERPSPWATAYTGKNRTLLVGFGCILPSRLACEIHNLTPGAADPLRPVLSQSTKVLTSDDAAWQIAKDSYLHMSLAMTGLMRQWAEGIRQRADDVVLSRNGDLTPTGRTKSVPELQNIKLPKGPYERREGGMGVSSIGR